MSTDTRKNHWIMALLGLPLLMAACDRGADQQPPAGDADAAEAPPIQRPTTAPDFGEWDGDGDLTLDRQEFGAWAADEGVFDDWFGDEGIDFAAVEEEIHGSLDVDGDGRVDQNDWTAVTEQLRKVFGGEYPGDWSEWDTDGNGELGVEEFRRAAAQRGLRDQMDVDGDGQVTEQDVHSHYFALLDENGDGRIDLAEWSANRSAWIDVPGQ